MSASSFLTFLFYSDYGRSNTPFRQLRHLAWEPRSHEP
jgi:hypothetical protein